jgi:predicted anti-sigma-YlaC factor YlaD
VRCETAREAISALIDDEDAGVDPQELDDHLLECPDCRAWQAAAHEVTRNARLEPVRPVMVPSEELVGAVLAHSRPPRRSVTWVRAGLVAVAAAQVWVTVPSLMSGHDHKAPEHIAHEIGAFAMALAVGFVVAAWKPDRARGMHALVGAVAALLVVTSTVDLLHGRTDLGEEAPHLVAVAGWLLLVYLAAATPSTTLDPIRSLTPVVRGITGRAKALTAESTVDQRGRRRTG